MGKVITYTNREVSAITNRQAGMKKPLAFRAVLEDTPGLADAVPPRVLASLAGEFFKAVDTNNFTKLESVRTRYKTLALQFMETPPAARAEWREDVEQRMGLAEKPAVANTSLVPDGEIGARYRKSMTISENVDSLVTIGTAQALMREAVEAIARRKRIIHETGLENSLDDKALPFSKLILDAIRLANDMLSPFQSKDAGALSGCGSLALQLIGAKHAIEERPEDYTAPPPNSVFEGDTK